jgi:hypothetical protein
MSVTTEETITDRLGSASTTAAFSGGDSPPLLAIVIPCLNEELVVEDTAR